ncbi:hypothetical protein FRC07_009958 [Ceratobasidium sp. 392]|nr:hypothetical protein FRC07_009958 [Ceratobasidium sp. 392]
MQCLQFEITRAQVNKLEVMIRQWVLEYKEYYYQYNEKRLLTCPLMIYALLHIVYFIRQTGLPSALWAFVREQFCGHMLLAVNNCVQPYDHLDNYVQHRTQMQIVSKVYHLPSLSKPLINFKYKNRVESSSCKVTYPELDGNRIRTALLINHDPIARNNSFIKYNLVPDANTLDKLAPDAPFMETQYGRLLDVFHLIWIANDGTCTQYLLGHVPECNTEGLDTALPKNPYVTFNISDMKRLSPTIINLQTVTCAIGRVHISGNKWAVVDQGRDCMRTQFVDEEGNAEFE